MNSKLNKFKPQRKLSMRMQITDAVRKMVLSGKLAAGSRLPSTQELASQWDAHVTTVQQALTPLVKEGLLERTPQVGTFVRKREERLTRVGIYASGDLWRNPASAFGRCLCNELHRQLGLDNISEEVWVDPRPTDEQGKPWDELVRAASERRFQVLIVPGVGFDELAWLKKLVVPTVFLTSANIRNKVAFDGSQWAETAMQLLADQGCHRVGAICSVLAKTSEDTGGNQSEYRQFYMALEKSAAHLGLEFRPEWLLRPLKPLANTGVEFAQFGYDSFQALWRLSERPEGIVVYEDVTSSGVLMAIMREHIRIPEKLKLVLHRNTEVGLFCPVPASFMDVHVGEVAAA
ncbi:MAG: GntR family transcriptional regulator, partial [Victivallales bacterium]